MNGIDDVDDRRHRPGHPLPDVDGGAPLGVPGHGPLRLEARGGEHEEQHHDDGPVTRRAVAVMAEASGLPA